MKKLFSSGILDSNVVINDNGWHLLSYERDEDFHSLNVDGEIINITCVNDFNSSISYDKLYIGENKTAPLNFTMELEDFISKYENVEINFIKGLFQSFDASYDQYTIIPNGMLPVFNWQLPIRNNAINISTTGSFYMIFNKPLIIYLIKNKYSFRLLLFQKSRGLLLFNIF